MSPRVSTAVRRAVAIALALAVPARADVTAPPPKSHPKATVCLVLSSEAARYGTQQSIELAANVRVRNGPAAPARHSFVEVRDAKGQLAFRTLDRAFFPGDEPLELALGFSTNAGPALPHLPPGDYAAVWLLDGARSNQARFSVGPGAPPPLAIELDDQGCAPGPQLSLHLYNPGPQPIDLVESLGGSELIVDGARFARQGINWDGGSLLSTGQSWGTTISFGEYGAPLTPGRHQVQLEMAGRRSNAIAVAIPAPSGARR